MCFAAEHGAVGWRDDFLAGETAGVVEVLDVDGNEGFVGAVVEDFYGGVVFAAGVGLGDDAFVEVVVDLPEAGGGGCFGADALLPIDGAAFDVLDELLLDLVGPVREQGLGGFGGGHELCMAQDDALVLDDGEGLQLFFVDGEGVEVAL